MKLAEIQSNVVVSNNVKAMKYRIKINQRSFKLLYGDLYSDPVTAVIRELSTNAADSHAAAGKGEVPFEVHLPNDLEPYFYVKDFGTGLSPDQICGEDGIYINFCDSNKTDTNDQTGCLGLGSKSPFAFSDNFQLESRYNGRAYLYTCFLNGEGEPSIAPMGDDATDEPNGITVLFAVAKERHQEFSDKAGNVLTWFKVRPNVVGHYNFEFKGREYMRSGERYGIHKERSFTSSDGSRVVMGNVAYPFFSSDFSYRHNITEAEKAVVEYGVDLFVDMGDVHFTPSRERLTLDDHTIANVKKYLSEAIKALHEQLGEQLNAQPTIWKARRMLHDIRNSILGKVRSFANVEYNGVKITDSFGFQNMVNQTMPNVDPLAQPTLQVSRLKKEKYRRYVESEFVCDGTPVYLNDLKSGGDSRISSYMNENGETKAYIITNVDAEFLRVTGIEEVVIRASTLPLPVRKKRERIASDGTRVMTTYTKRTVVQEYSPAGGKAVDYWSDVEVDLRDGGVYVICSYGQIMDDVHGQAIKRMPSEIREKYNAIVKLRPNFKLYGIRPAHIHRLNKYKSRWTRLEDFATKVLGEEYPKVANEIKLLEEYNAASDHDRYNPFVGKAFNPGSTFGRFMEIYSAGRAVRKREDVLAVMVLNRQVQSPIALPEVKELRQLEKDIVKAYPLLEHIYWYGNDSSRTVALYDYITALDAQYSLRLEAV